MNKTLCLSATMKLGIYDSASCLFVHGPLCVITADCHKTRGNNTSPYFTVTFTK